MPKSLIGNVQVMNLTTWRELIAIRPYTGRYPQFFDCVLVLSSPHTRSGQIETAYHSQRGVIQWKESGKDASASSCMYTK
jgi:hypothetical protein